MTQKHELIALAISGFAHAALFICSDSVFFSHAAPAGVVAEPQKMVFSVSFYLEGAAVNEVKPEEKVTSVPEEQKKADLSLSKKLIKKKEVKPENVIKKDSPQNNPSAPESKAPGDNLNAGAQTTGTREAAPDYISNPAPQYPESARRMKREGVVHLLVTVTAGGGVKDVKVKESSGSAVLGEAATAAVMKWKFTPGTVAGVAVESQVAVPVRFQLK